LSQLDANNPATNNQAPEIYNLTRFE
jgi:hypothetical protein